MNPDVRRGEGRERGRARPQAEDRRRRRRGHDGHRAERQRRPRRGGERLVPARPARLHDRRCRRTARPPTRRARTTSTRRSTSTAASAAGEARRAGAREAVEPADVRPLPRRSARSGSLDPGSMLIVVLGQTFHNELTAPPPAPRARAPAAGRARRRRAPALELLQAARAAASRSRSRCPTILERSSNPDTCPATSRCASTGSTAAEQGRAARLQHRRERVLGDRGDELGRRAGPRRQELPRTTSAGASSTSTTAGSHLHMVVLHAHGASYWVVNTLLDSLSNETMLAIAKGLQPLPGRPAEVSRVARPTLSRKDRHLRRGLGRPRHRGLLRRARPRRRVRDIVPERIDALRRGEVPFHETDVPELLERNRDRLTFTLDADDVAGCELALRLRRHAADALGRRRPLARLERRRGAAGARRAAPILVMKSTVPVGTGEKVRAGARRARALARRLRVEPGVPRRGPRGRRLPAPGPGRGRRVRRRPTATRSPRCTSRSARRSCAATSTRRR